MGEQDLANLKANLRGALIGRADSEYDEARKLYNGMIDKRPLAIARCADVADVITAVNFGRDNRLLVDRVGRALHDSHGRTPRSPVVKPNRPIPGFQLPNSNLDPAGRLTSRRRRTIS